MARRLAGAPRATLVVLGLVGLTAALLALRAGLHAYRCHVVDQQAMLAQTRLAVDSAAPDWLLNWLGRPFSFALAHPTLSGRISFPPGASAEEVDHVVSCLAGLTSLASVTMQGHEVCDAHILSLRRLRGLNSLDLESTRVTAGGLNVLDSFPQLSTLFLPENESVSDDALVPISRASQLLVLSLRNTQITDAGLPQLTALRRLQFLDLDRTAVTDAGLLELRGMPALKMLSVSQTKVTESGIAALRAALPDLEVTDD